MPNRHEVGPTMSAEYCIPRNDAYCLTGNQRELQAFSSCSDPTGSLNDDDGKQIPRLKRKSCWLWAIQIPGSVLCPISL